MLDALLAGVDLEDEVEDLELEDLEHAAVEEAVES